MKNKTKENLQVAIMISTTFLIYVLLPWTKWIFISLVIFWISKDIMKNYKKNKAIKVEMSISLPKSTEEIIKGIEKEMGCTINEMAEVYPLRKKCLESKCRETKVCNLLEEEKKEIRCYINLNKE